MEKLFEGRVYGRMHTWMDGQTDGRMNEWTNGRTHDGHNAMTIAQWPLASGAKTGKVSSLTRFIPLNYTMSTLNDQDKERL